MFTVSQNPKADEAGFAYELEKKLRKDPAERQKMKKMVETREQEVKEELRTGGAQEEFRQMETLLAGYGALKKVVARVK